MDVQKYIKRLKFARADMSRATGPFETYDEAINFLNSREFFFGDPFVVKYKDREDNGEVKLLLAIGKAENVSVTEGMAEVSGSTGEDAYELYDINGIKDQLEELYEKLEQEIADREAADEALQANIDAEASARTEADNALQEQIDEVKDAIDGINDLISELSGATQDIKEIVGEGWVDSPDNVTITDRIKKDEQLAGIVWGHNDGEPYDGHLANTELPYASGESLAEMIETISNTLDGVLFEDEGETKAVKFEYNSARNILYYTAGTETGEIKLSQAAVVDRAYYDAETEELVIEFILGEGEKQEVRIPVGGLITEWDVKDTETVHLKKDRTAGSGPDILSAEVKVSDDSDNMLVAKQDGLYVSNSGVTNLENVLGNVKDVLQVAEDGHFVEGSFTGSHTQGLGNYLDAVNALDDAITAAENATDALANDVDAKYGELNEKIDSGDTSLANSISELAAGVADEISARENIELVELPQGELEPDVRAAYVLSNNGETGTTVIKIYKDSVIYKIYFGHVDDQITSPTDPTVIPGTGETAICFIYFNANGEYALSTNEFKITDELWAALGNESIEREEADGRLEDMILELADAVQEEQGVVSIALNRLAEGVVAAKTVVELDENSSHLKLTKYTGTNGESIYRLKEANIASESDVEEGFDNINSMLEELSSSIMSDMNSFNLSYDSDEQDLVLTWEVDGVEKTARVDVSDFVKDSFLENVQVVTRDGVQYLEFRFKTYDGEPIPIYIPLTDLATIYSAGDGIDKDELENNQVITVKIDEFARKNYLAKSANGLLVTGVTEEIQEAISGIDLSEYVKVEDVEDFLDSASTNPVQNKVIFNALSNLDLDGYVKTEDVEDFLDSASTNPVQNKVIFDALSNLDLDGYVKVEDVEDFLDSASTNPVQNQVITRALNDLDERKADITYVDQAIEGVRIDVDDHLDSASTNPVENRAIVGTIFDIEEAIAAAFNDLDQKKADRDELNGLGDRISNVETNLSNNYYNKTEIDDMFADSASAMTDDLNALWDALNNEIEERAEGDADLHDEVLEEVSARTEADSELYNMITAETQAREEADNAIKDDLDDETSARTAADNYLQGQIDGKLSDVEMDGTGSVITSVTKNANTVVAHRGDVPTASTTNYGVIMLDDHFDSASTNPVMNCTITQALLDDEEVVAAALNDLNNKKADIEYVDNRINSITGDVSNCVTGVTPSGTGNVVTGITKNGKELVVGMGEVDLSGAITGVTTATAATATQFVSAVAKNGQDVEATLVNIDDALSSASTNPVQNKAVTKIIIENELITSAALNDLNRRKANIEDVPLTLSELEGYSDMATKDNLRGFLPLSGGTMTGNISGDTGVAVYMPGGFFQQSDETLKIFMGEIENALDKANQIPTKYFYWKNMPDGPRQLGTSAQKVREVFPEIVSGDEKLSVDYSKLAIVALAAVKELTAKVEDLQKQLDELKK